MKRGYHGNLLLVELIVVVLFFSIAGSISLGVFVAARQTEKSAALLTSCEQEGQNLLSVALADENSETRLEDIGFEETNGVFVRQDGDCTWTVSVSRSAQTAGVMLSVSVTATDASGHEITTLQRQRYFSREV